MKIKRKKISKKSSGTKTKTVDKPKSSKTPAKKSAKGGKKAATKKTPTPPKEMNKLTGFVVGSDQDIIAMELLAGGASRGEIGQRVAKKLNPTTKNGTQKPITNLVSSVYNKLVAKGYRTEETFKVLQPTPASKRKATLAAKGK